jgi:hypothetical protein
MTQRSTVAFAHAFTGALLLCAIWLALPARFFLVDAGGTALAVGALGAASGLFLHKPWALPLARAVAWVELVTGTLLISALAWSTALLAGSYGPVGSGGALLMGTVALLVMPYLVVLPALQIAWLRDTT